MFSQYFLSILNTKSKYKCSAGLHSVGPMKYTHFHSQRYSSHVEGVQVFLLSSIVGPGLIAIK